MDLFESFSEDITKWEVLRDMVDLDLNDNFSDDSVKSGPRVQLLPRKCITLFGNIPKMEQRIYSKCKECRLIFNPRNILSHRVCLGRGYSFSSSSFDLKKKSKSKSSKKSHSNTPSPPPFKKPPSPTTPVSSSAITDLSKMLSSKVPKVSTSINVSPPPTSSSHKSSSRLSSSSHNSKTVSSHLTRSEHHHSSSKTPKSSSSSTDISNGSTSTSKSSSSSSHSSSSSSSSRHKKSRKSSSSNSKSNEEYDPNIHCGVVENNKGPCTRSLSCSNHRSHLRKLVSSRSKEVHHLIAERKTLKEKDTKHNNSKTHSSPNGPEIKDTGESCGHTTVKSNTLSIILPKTKDSIPSQNSATSNKQLLDITDLDIKFSKTAEVSLNNEGDAETVPVVYMPMSPVSVVSPVEYVKIGKNIIRLESPQSATSPPLTINQSVFVGIPNFNVKMYTSHPKPITLPSYGVKKIGGAMLLSKQQLELQRNNLLMTISSNANTGNNIESYRTSLNNSGVLYKTNILKSKNNNKSNNYKRSISEKLNSSDTKHMKYSPNLNGFLIHSTISETADAPLSNVMMNDNMPYFNIK